MSNALLSIAWKLPRIEPLAKLLLARLACASNDAGECWPSITTLEAETGMARASVCKWLKWLESKGLVERYKRINSTGYILHLDKWNPEPPTSPPHGLGGSATRTSPPRVLVRHTDQSSPPHGLELVRHTDSTSPPHGPKPKENPKENPTEPTTPADSPEVRDGEQLPYATDEFREAWDAWESDRKERRKKITVQARKLQWKALRKMGHDRAIAAINHSIEKGYTGIFEPTPSRHSRNSGSNPLPPPTDGNDF